MYDMTYGHRLWKFRIDVIARVIRHQPDTRHMDLTIDRAAAGGSHISYCKLFIITGALFQVPLQLGL